MTTKRETRRTGASYRFVTVQREAINAETRTAELSFSSEVPVERGFGSEVLDHSPSSVRLGRLTDGGAVLLDHDQTRLIGVVERVEIGDDRVGRAVVRFGRSAEAESAWQDVQDGIRKHVSVGYFVHNFRKERSGDEDMYRATDWEPFEISLVSIPADPTVGVGRSAELQVETVFESDVEETPVEPVIPQPEVRSIQVMENTNQPAIPNGEAIERERTRQIAELGEQYGKYITPKDTYDAIRNGKTPEQFREVIMDKMQSAHTDTRGAQVGMTQKEAQRYSFARALQAAVTGDWSKAGFEREASLAMARVLGNSPEGFYVPNDIFRRDFNVGTSTEAGNLVATDLRTDLYVDALRNALAMGRLGCRILPGLTSNIDIPRKSATSSIGRLTEIGSASETNPLIQKLTLSPKRFGGYVEVSKQAIIQASMQLEAMIRDDLLVSAAVFIEGDAINGTGSPQITGLRNVAGMGTVAAGVNGATVSWAHLVGLETAVANANAEPDRTAGYLINTRIRGAAKTVQRGTNLDFIWRDGDMPLNGYRAAVTNNVPNNLTKGTSTTVCSAALFASDWTMGVMGLFGAPDIVVDPYSKADTGQVKITLNQFADFVWRQPGAIAKVEDLLT